MYTKPETEIDGMTAVLPTKSLITLKINGVEKWTATTSNRRGSRWVVWRTSPGATQKRKRLESFATTVVWEDDVKIIVYDKTQNAPNIQNYRRFIPAEITC